MKQDGQGKLNILLVYRVHDTPKPDSLANFALFAARFGYKDQYQIRQGNCKIPLIFF